MKHSVMLTVASLLTLLLMIIHLTQDVMRQADGSMLYPIPVVIMAIWLYGTLMLSERVLGYVIMFLGGVIGAGMMAIHTKGGVVSKSGGFFFVWTLFTLSATGWFTAILSAQGLWAAFRSRRPRLPAP